MSVNVQTAEGLLRIAGNGGKISETAEKWENPININGMVVDGSADRTNFFTNGGVSGNTNIFLNAIPAYFKLIPGAVAHVKLKNGADIKNKKPIINIEPWGGGTTAEIRCNGGEECNCLTACPGEIMSFIYTGEYFEHIGGGFVGKYFKSDIKQTLLLSGDLTYANFTFSESDSNKYQVSRIKVEWTSDNPPIILDGYRNFTAVHSR